MTPAAKRQAVSGRGAGELLIETLSFTIGQARSAQARWVDDYKTKRPHSSPVTPPQRHSPPSLVAFHRERFRTLSLTLACSRKKDRRQGKLHPPALPRYQKDFVTLKKKFRSRGSA